MQCCNLLLWPLNVLPFCISLGFFVSFVVKSEKILLKLKPTNGDSSDYLTSLKRAVTVYFLPFESMSSAPSFPVKRDNSAGHILVAHCVGSSTSDRTNRQKEAAM